MKIPAIHFSYFRNDGLVPLVGVWRRVRICGSFGDGVIAGFVGGNKRESSVILEQSTLL
jgi:hypothetical protein